MAVMLFLLPLIAASVARFGLKTMGETAILWVTTVLSATTALLAWAGLLRGAAEPSFLATWAESGTLSTSITLGFSENTGPWLAGFTSLMLLSQLSVHGWSLPKGAWTKGASYRVPLAGTLSLFNAAGILMLMSADVAQFSAGAILVVVLAASLTGFDHRRQAAGRASQRLLIICLGGALALLLAAALAYLAIDSSELALVLHEPLEDFSVSLANMPLAVPSTMVVLVSLFATAWLGQVPFHSWLRFAGAAPGPVLPVLVIGLPWLALFVLSLFLPMLSAFPAAIGFLAGFAALSALLLGAMALGEIDVRKVMACLAGVQASLALMAFMLVGPNLGLKFFVSQALCIGLLAWGASAVFQARDHDGIHDGELAEMGGLRRAMPWTYGAMLLGAFGLSASGLPFASNGAAFGTGGFAPLVELYGATFGSWMFWALIGVGVLGSAAAWRAILLAFHGTARKAMGQNDAGASDAGWATKGVLMLMGLGVVVASILGASALSGSGPTWITALPLVTFAVGLVIAIMLTVTKRYTPMGTLFSEGIRIENAYDTLLIRPASWLGDTARWFDLALHDRALNAVSERLLPRVQRGMDRPGTKRIAPYALGTAVALLLVSTLMAMVGT